MLPLTTASPRWEKSANTLILERGLNGRGYLHLSKAARIGLLQSAGSPRFTTTTEPQISTTKRDSS